MKIGEVAKIVGLSTSAIRFYERHGLLGSSRVSRAENGYRVYSSRDIEEILLIVKFKELGLELEEIKSLLSEESKSCNDLVSSLQAQIVKYRKMEDLIKNRIRLLVSAETQCKLKCNPDNSVKNCCK
jgi:DNA-binding transcriptional MerR regulator